MAMVLVDVEDNDLLFFASGVSDSKEVRQREFFRERDLLLDQDKNSHLVYFSSLGAMNPTTEYLIHKRNMELLIDRTFHSNTIVRIGNITWGNNPNTIINYLKRRISSGESFNIRDEYKHLISREELIYWMHKIPKDRNVQMNLTGRMVKVSKIVEEIISGKL
jgi:hypothetical protein